MWMLGGGLEVWMRGRWVVGVDVGRVGEVWSMYVRGLVRSMEECRIYGSVEEARVGLGVDVGKVGDVWV